MMVRKRSRGPMKRTASMTGIRVDLGDGGALEPADPGRESVVVVGGPSGVDPCLMGMVSPRYHGKSYGGVFADPFLKTCGLCKRRLLPGRDLYMYRGDTAFCSLECREQQMKNDERKEKWSMEASKRDENHHPHHSPPPPPPATGTSQA
ncbi:senescence-associated family protein, putative [Actinidia rufa]|uniref:Senescence-associated family protein, putative n=1 Tax=Actinidia rufa TaxID=165716 RepID=A0A7J0E297_9ERIC|nr:senescence-associated family protein, putative [Actinidia rufa]